MIGLVFSDLRAHAATWVGAFAVAMVCGYVGGWVASLMATAGFYTDELYKFLQNAGSMMLVFSLIAGIAVLVSTAGLTVSLQRRSYALWQLANVRPSLVSVVVLAQLAVVAVLGAICGTLLTLVTFGPLFPLVFAARSLSAQIVPQVGTALFPVVWMVVAGVFVCGGMKGARSAGKTPPLTALREPEPKRMRLTWIRALLCTFLVVCVCLLFLAIRDSEPDLAMIWAIFVPVLVVAAMVPLSPLVLPWLLTLWTAVVPPKSWTAWYLARRTARYGLSTSTSIETPIMVSFGLVAGLFSVINVLAAFARNQGTTDTSGYFLDATLTFVMLGGPVLLCGVGAAVSVVMSSGARTRDVALLNAAGAQPVTQLLAAGCEAFIHTVNATLAGIVGVIISNTLVALALGLPFFEGLSLMPGLVVSFVGFVLVLFATLVPTSIALSRETAVVLGARE